MAAAATTGPMPAVQAAALARIARRMARADQPPWLHGEVARRMAARLSLIRRQPRSLIDWGSFNGASQALLREAYPHAEVLRVETDARLQQRETAVRGPRWWSALRRGGGPAVTVAAGAELPAAKADLLWANMALHQCSDPAALLQRWHQAVAVDGFVMFSTLGPGTLLALSRLYARCGWPAPFAPFVDMHDLGDMLLHCGFDDPVMDQEIVTLTWNDADALLRELRSLGGNAHVARTAGLRTPRWRARLCDELQQLRGGDGRLRLEFELVYGHAFRVAPRPRVAAQTSVSLDDMRSMVRAGRRADRGGEGVG